MEADVVHEEAQRSQKVNTSNVAQSALHFSEAKMPKMKDCEGTANEATDNFGVSKATGSQSSGVPGQSCVQLVRMCGIISPGSVRYDIKAKSR